MAKKRSKKKSRGLGGATGQMKHLSAKAYEQLLRRSGMKPLARGDCRTVAVKSGRSLRHGSLCRLPTGPVLVLAR